MQLVSRVLFFFFLSKFQVVKLVLWWKLDAVLLESNLFWQQMAWRVGSFHFFSCTCTSEELNGQVMWHEPTWTGFSPHLGVLFLGIGMTRRSLARGSERLHQVLRFDERHSIAGLDGDYKRTMANVHIRNRDERAWQKKMRKEQPRRSSRSHPPQFYECWNREP